MLFDKLSPPADFISKIQSQLDILMKNVLYCTHELDKIKKIVNKIDTNTSLQKQVDDYFEDDAKDIPEEKFEDKPGDIKWSSAK